MSGVALGWKHNYTEGIATKGHGDGFQIIEWPEALGPKPDAAQVAVIVAEYERAEAIKAIKAKANKDIIDLWPSWKQRNMTAEAVMMLVEILVTNGVLTQAQVDAHPGATDLKDIWAQVVARRQQSDDEEAAL